MRETSSVGRVVVVWMVGRGGCGRRLSSWAVALGRRRSALALSCVEFQQAISCTWGVSTYESHETSIVAVAPCGYYTLWWEDAGYDALSFVAPLVVLSGHTLIARCCRSASFLCVSLS